jgi:hypothetical protein
MDVRRVVLVASFRIMKSTLPRTGWPVPRRRWAKCLLGALLLAGASARGDLKWQATRLEFHPALADKEVKAEFPFTNDGSAPVIIDSVVPGCGCTTAALDKMTYQPGGKGLVKATFTIGERTGFQDKVIRVKIHGVQEPVVLTMATYIPELLRIEPRYVFWRAGDPPQPRIIKLTVMPGVKLTVPHVFSVNPRFKATVQTIHEGSFYLLDVTPVDTATDASTVLDIEAMAAPGIAKKFEALANIVPK